MVFEESFLFSDSIRDNLAYGHPDATDAEVVAAAEAAEADGFIRELPFGYDTVVGERGLTLSGGQRQRIALARSLLTDPRILILDDATSSVDARIEEEIHTTLRRLMQGRTTILIAHRRSTLRLAHRIAVLERGELLDVGTHEELLERCSLYRQLLAGPGDSVEEPEPLVEQTDDEPAGITESAWPRDEDAEGNRAQWTTAESGKWPVFGGGGGFGAGLAGAMPATPELLARVAALPPADDAPQLPDAADVDAHAYGAATGSFSLPRFTRPFRGALLHRADVRRSSTRSSDWPVRCSCASGSTTACGRPTSGRCGSSSPCSAASPCRSGSPSGSSSARRDGRPSACSTPCG